MVMRMPSRDASPGPFRAANVRSGDPYELSNGHPVYALAPQPFGRTGLSTPPLGLGAGRIGRSDVSEAEVERLLHGSNQG